MAILIDNGHGSNTKGKQSPILDDDMKIEHWFVENNRFKEYRFARIIARNVYHILKEYGHDVRLVVEEEEDIPLSERVNRVNKICKKYGNDNVILVSIHANAVGNSSAWMNGRGWEAYTTVGQTKSDVLAECLYKRAEKNLRGRKMRKDMTDRDSDKESNFYILKNTSCPAVLTENFFYDNKDDLRYMTSDEGVHCIIRTHVEGILDYLGEKKENKK